MKPCVPCASALVIAVLAGLLLACGDDEPAIEEGTEQAAPAGREAPPAAETERAPARVAVPPASVEMLEGGELPEGFPEDIPLYPGAKSSAAMAHAGPGLTVGFESREPPGKIFAFYREALVGDGWEIDQESELEGHHAIIASKGSRKAAIMIGPTAKQTLLSISVREEE